MLQKKFYQVYQFFISGFIPKAILFPLMFVTFHWQLQAQEISVWSPQLPPSSEEFIRDASSDDSNNFRPLAEGTLWQIGDMTAEEQLYVELINRARANPPEEGRWLLSLTDADVLRNLSFFNVELDQVLDDPIHGFLKLPSAPPLAPNALLNAGARVHVEDMFVNTFQAHHGSDGSRAGDRVKSQGYNWRRVGENVFSTVDSIIHGHAGFQIDWGIGPGGIQSPPGHRLTIHNTEYREIGVGVKIGSRPNAFPGNPDPIYRDVGPQLVAQVMASPLNDMVFVTGVAFYDFNQNQFYDLGEGLGDVAVDIPGNAFHTVTVDSGGYAVPVNGDGSYEVQFSNNALPSQNSTVTVANQDNVKLDYMLPYQPVVSGPSVVGVNQTVGYELPSMPLAERFQLERSRSAVFAQTEGGASGLDEFNYSGVGSYNVIQTRLFDEGGQAFRLAHDLPISNEILEWNRRFEVGDQASLSFRSRLGSAFEGEIATFQVSNDEGQTWQTLWSQNGTTQNGAIFPAPSETAFTTRSIDLSEFAGQTIRFRWVYRFTSGGFFRGIVGNEETVGTGWYFDTITAEGLNSLVSEFLPEQVQRNFQISSGQEGSFSLRGRAFIKGEWRPWGDAAHVVVTSKAPEGLEILSVRRNGAFLVVQVDVGAGGEAPVIESADQLQGPWQSGGASSILQAGQASVYEVTMPIENQPTRFIRIAP